MINELENVVNVDNLEEYGRVSKDKDFRYLCNVSDTLSWVSGEISTATFKSDAYINLNGIKKKAKYNSSGKKEGGSGGGNFCPTVFSIKVFPLSLD